jgi:hypothetical protein
LPPFNKYIGIFQFAFFLVGPNRCIFDQEVFLLWRFFPAIAIKRESYFTKRCGKLGLLLAVSAAVGALQSDCRPGKFITGSIFAHTVPNIGPFATPLRRNCGGLAQHRRSSVNPPPPGATTVPPPPGLLAGTVEKFSFTILPSKLKRSGKCILTDHVSRRCAFYIQA